MKHAIAEYGYLAVVFKGVLLVGALAIPARVQAQSYITNFTKDNNIYLEKFNCLSRTAAHANAEIVQGVVVKISNWQRAVGLVENISVACACSPA